MYVSKRNPKLQLRTNKWTTSEIQVSPDEELMDFQLRTQCRMMINKAAAWPDLVDSFV